MLYMLFFFFRCVVLLNGVISSGEPDSTFGSAAFEYECRIRCRFSKVESGSSHLVSELKVETLAQEYNTLSNSLEIG